MTRRTLTWGAVVLLLVRGVAGLVDAAPGPATAALRRRRRRGRGGASVVGGLEARRTATLGLGCFWAPSEALLAVAGVEATTCGFAGGTFDAAPTYDSVCRGDGNVEVVRVIYDDATLDYERVLDAALACAKPSPEKRQYAPVVFVQDDDERRRAEAWQRLAKIRDTDGLRSSDFAVQRLEHGFWVAERYHQAYWQTWRPRYALLALCIVAQVALPLDGRLHDLCTVVTFAIAALATWERAFGGAVRKLAPDDLNLANPPG